MFILLSVGVTQSCTDDFEEMNRNPFNPTEASIPTVFNKVTSSFLLGYMEQNAIHNGYYYYVTQQLAGSAPRYILAQGVDEMWGNYYTTLKNIRWLEKEMDNSSLKVDNIRACLNILFAYKTLRTADYYGDMPFSKAGYGAEGSEFYRVAYDKHADIYKTCLDMLKTAAEGFSTADDQLSFDGGDVLFNEDFEMWKKFANSIRLRYAMQIVDIDNPQAAAHISNILGDAATYPLISGDEILGLWPKRLAGMTIASRPWSFSAENNTCMGTSMWNYMSDNDNTDGSGIFDPRTKVFFETNNDNEWVPQAQIGSNLVNTGKAYSFGAFPNGRDNASTIEEWENKDVGTLFSSVNFYIASDDDTAPEIFMTVAEVHFLKAEAYNRGIGVSKNAATAEAEYEAGIRSSINFWYNLVELKGVEWYVFKPELATDDVDTYLAHSRVAFSANETDALNQIYAQVWLDSFRQPWVAFNLYRRTEATPHDISADSENNFFKVPYPEKEKNFNEDNFNAALNGKENTPNNKLFWHK